MRLSLRLPALAALLTLLPSCLAFTNPIRRPGGADPFLTLSGDGYYYALSTTWNDVQIARATTIEGLKNAPRKTVYQTTGGSRCCNVWAPEMHWMGDAWYIYFTAGDGASLDSQRSQVLRGGVSAWDDPWSFAGTILPNEWSIDGTVLRTSFGNYFVSSCFHGRPYQSICIQRLNPDNASTSGPVNIISEPDQPFERVAHPVNEGPAALYFNGRTHIAYSASYCWSDAYCIGLLTWDGRTDPMERNAWRKAPGCQMSSGNGHLGTGHNSFLTSPAGDKTWTVYHATANAGGACDDSRYMMVQPLGVKGDGMPEFGVPAPFGQWFDEPNK